MRMKKSRRWLSALLAILMLLTMIPTVAFAAGSTSDGFYKIVHLDCGRKYFSADWIKTLIDDMAEDGYTHLELAFGNDGLRFLLDDMSVTVDETTYTDEQVTAGVQAGNKAYYDFDTNELTENEMDSIIAHANTKGIEIIPLLNTPGHMDAIITAMDYVGIDGDYNGSVRTVDVTNEAAVAFTQALVGKYIDYFAGKGCSVFNIGADEYANDVYTTGGMGFAQLVNAGQYDEFVTYINDLAGLVSEAGMTPMAFNDGIYYNSTTSYGTFDSKIMIAYWSSGWSGYNVASASYLANKGHKMINTNGDFYYVLGKTDSWDNNGSSYADNWDNAKFMGTTFDSEQAGSMFCIWCDYPNAETEDEIYTKVVANGVLSAMSKAMGHMPESGGSTDPKDVTVEDTATGVSVTAQGLTSIEVKEQQAVTSGNTVSKTYSITLNGGAYKGEAAVRIPYDKAFDGCTNFVGTVGSDPFKVERDGNYFAATVPHFSDVTITATLADTGDDPQDTVTSGDGTAASYVLDTDGLDADAQYLIVYQASSSATSGKALNTSKGSLDVTISDSKATPSGDASAALWTYSTESGSWSSTNEYLFNGSSYLYPRRSGRYNNYTYTLYIDSTKTAVSINNNNGTYTIATTNILNAGYVNYSSNGWTASSSSQDLYFYKYTPGTTSYKVEPALQESRITALTVDNDGYTDDSWNAYKNALDAANAKLNEVKNANYSSETAASAALNELIGLVDVLKIAYNNLKEAVTITINYQTEDGAVVYTETRTVAEGTATITLSNVIETDGKTYVPVDTSLSLVKDQTVYTVIVTEMPFDPSTVNPLEIEYWITNQKVTIDGATSGQIVATAAYAEAGVKITDLVPANDGAAEKKKIFWKAVCLPSGHHQEENSADMTGSTYAKQIGYIRYWNSTWAYSSDGQTWVSITDSDQIVAYYMQETQVTQEITTNVVDWGQDYAEWKAGKDNRWFWDGYVQNGSKFVFLDFAVVYEDGTQNPSSFPVDNTWFFHFDGCSVTNPRVLGSIVFNENDEFEIWKVTVQDGTCTGYSSASTFTPTYSGEETVVWDESMGGTPSIDSLSYTANRSGKLIRVYVRAKVTEDSLAVHYIDQTTDQEFYDYNIAVGKGTIFDAGFALGTTKNTLVNNSVTNIKGVTQTVTANLSEMSEVGAQYRYSDYTCVKVVRSEDGKDVYLYYTFNNAKSFVIDFGLPLKITKQDLNIDVDWTSATVTNGTYGTAKIENDALIYTPTTVLKGADSLTLTLTEDSTTISHTIYIYPASNVLYEETFLTKEDSGKYQKWSHEGTISGTQSSAQDTLYGYDAAYATKFTSGNSMDSSYTVELASGQTTENLRVSLGNHATGFDLIGTCGPNTGNVYVMLKNTNTGKVILVDTSYNDSTYDGDRTLHQVPLAHAVFDKGAYDEAIIFGAYRTTGTTQGSKIEIDGFRVYYPTDNDAYKDASGEKGATYVNVLDSVNASTAAYIEPNNSQTSADPYSKADYQSKGGPQNEIYLAPEQSVAFNVGTGVEKVQISARAVSDDTGKSVTMQVNGAETKSITSNTEMYYEVEVSNGLVTIKNTSANLLALGNIKLPSGAQTVALTEANLRAVYAMLSAASAPQVFTPDKIDFDVRSTNVIRNKVVTLTVKTSTDVSYLLVNNKKITPVNKRLVDRGFADEYVFVISDVVNRNTDVEYEIYAYDQDSTVSALYTVNE